MKLEDVQTFEVGEEADCAYATPSGVVERIVDGHVWWRDNPFDAARKVPMQHVYVLTPRGTIRVPANEVFRRQAPAWRS